MENQGSLIKDGTTANHGHNLSLISNDNISMESLSELTGFPLEYLKTELFGEKNNSQDVSIDELRDVMVNYLNKTMME